MSFVLKRKNKESGAPNQWRFDKETWNRMVYENYKTGLIVFENDPVKLSSEEYYSNNQISIEGPWEFFGVVKFVDFMWVVQDDTKTCIPFCDIWNEEIEIEVVE